MDWTRPAARRLDRRTFLQHSAAAGLALAAARCAAPLPPPEPADPTATPAAVARPSTERAAAPPAGAGPRNLLLVTVDTWRADHVGCYGGPATPTADRLAAESVRFANAYCQLPQTTPSHTALFTGQYPATNGVRISQHQMLAPGATTLASVLSQAGYRTGGLHSWYSLDGSVLGLDQGFETYRGLIVPAGSTEPAPLADAIAAWQRGENVTKLYDGRADLITDAAIDWLDTAARDRERPFFLWVHYRDPHYPYTAPTPYADRFAPPCAGCADGSFGTLNRVWDGGTLEKAEIERVIAAYDAEIAFADAELGRLLGRLDALGLAPRTLVVLTSDHGESFAEHDEWFHGKGLYQSTIHVPLLMRLPDVLPAGSTVHAAAQVIDVLPTALDLLDVPVPGTVDGRSLRPAIAGQSLDDYVAVAEVADRRYNALIQGEWKLLRDQATGQRALYHLPSDPAERVDRFAAEPATASRLDALLREWDHAHG